MGKTLRNPDYTPHANGESIAFNERVSFFGNHIVTNPEPSKKLSYFNEKSLLEFVSLDKKSKVPQLIIEKHSLDGELKIEYSPCDLPTFNVFNNLDSIGARRNDKFGPAILLPLNNGLFVFKDYKFSPLLTGPDVGKDFSVNLSFFSDRQGNYWICTPRGIHKFTPSQKQFQVLFNKEAFDMRDPLGNQVRGIFADAAGNVWTGGHFGLVFYDKKEGKYFSKLKVADDIWIHCFDKRDDKVYFFGSGCHSIDLPDMAVSRNYLLDLNLDPKAYRSTIGFIWAQYPLPGERYLLGNDHGKLLVWNIRENSITPVESCRQAMPFSNFIYRIIFSPKDQHYWAVGGSGCYRISKDLCITDFYGTENVVDEKHRMPVSDLRDLYEDPDGIFWLATNGEGLLRWDRANGNFQSFTIQDGMPSNTLYNILPDDFGNIWVSTDNGLVRFNLSTHYINAFSAKDGIAHNEFNRISSYKGADGTMYFGGIDGLTAFHPRDFGTDMTDGQIPLQITNFNQFLGSNNQLTNLTHELLTKQEITLHPGDKFFSLEFALLDFQSPVSYYKYQIEGFDKEWQYIQEPLLRISGLPYGNYTLRIAGQSYSGAWSKQELAIPIHVLRRYYLRWWAFVLYGLALLTILYIIREYQIKQVLEKADKLRLQEIDLLKTKLYTNITHEFRTPLTVILGMAEQLESDPVTSSHPVTNAVNLIKRNGQNLLRLINQMLDLSKLDSGKMSVDWELGDVVLFLQYLSESFHSYAATKHIQLTFYPEVKSLEMDYDREKLQQIISNLLSNAVKFTPEKGKVILHVSEVIKPGSTVSTSIANSTNNHFLQIKISNTGIGISAEHIANIFDRFYQADDAIPVKARVRVSA
ncbi:MAG: hypothetical protein IPM82_10950 [Saprospiraceae bacterium]|nr:hypothetical protein [Saprospiraceae bacterium]